MLTLSYQSHHCITSFPISKTTNLLILFRTHTIKTHSNPSRPNPLHFDPPSFNPNPSSLITGPHHSIRRPCLLHKTTDSGTVAVVFVLRCGRTHLESGWWCGVVRSGVVWCGVGLCGVVWCGVVRSGVVWCGVVWCALVWCGVVWCGVVWCALVWCGVVWCGEVMVCGCQVF